MRHLLSLFLISIAFTAFAEAVLLPTSTMPIRCDVMQSEIWDFSRQEVVDEDAGMMVRVYGDSLLTETFGGRRFLYGISNDSISFLKNEESRL